METVYKAAGIKYVVMTNIPFDPKEAVHWLTESGKFEDTVQQTYNVDQFKSALRIDPLLKGDWGTIKDCLAKTGLPQNLDGARKYLKEWAKVYKPLYLMASTPADFLYGEGDTPIGASTRPDAQL